jgi:hypothetical protein
LGESDRCLASLSDEVYIDGNVFLMDEFIVVVVGPIVNFADIYKLEVV